MLSDIMEVKEILEDISAYIELANEVATAPNCNNCGRIHCINRIDQDQLPRINCINWSELDDEIVGETINNEEN